MACGGSAFGVQAGHRLAAWLVLVASQLLHNAGGLAAIPISAAESLNAKAHNSAQRRGDRKAEFRRHGAHAPKSKGMPDAVAPERLQAMPNVLSEPAPEMTSPYLRQEYQCGSEYSEPKYGCKNCNMNRTCACDGLVRFGYGNTWSDFIESPGEIECESRTFGVDPDFGHGKVCMCRPRVFMCASEWSKPWANCAECNMKRNCNCVGQVRFGYAENWGDWQDVNGTISCERSSFGDPVVGQGKVCQCQPLDLYAEPIHVNADGGAVGGVLTSIIIVVLTYFFVYVLLAIVRTMNTICQGGASEFEKVLEIATTHCVYFAPMLCVVFFAVSKRADTLTAGASREYGLPPDWLQLFVGVCAVSFAVQTLAFLFAEWFATRGVITVQGNGAFDDSRTVNVRIQHTPRQAQLVGCWRAICNVAICVMYIALGCSIVGVLLMEEPDAVRDERGSTPVSAGTVCTLVLALVYFSVYLLVHLFRNQEYYAAVNGVPTGSFGFEVMKLAATAMNFAPMLCILFMGSQIAVDWAGIVSLPNNATTWMYICLASILLQVCLVIAAPFLSDAEMHVVGPSGEADFQTRNHGVFVCLSIVRWLAMSVLYLGVVVVCASLWSTDAAPAMTHQLFRFVWVYFAVYLALWAAITARQLSGGGCIGVIRVLSICKDTVVLCPMMAALYLGSFVRAHHITNVYGVPGEPQNYVQDFMLISAIAVEVQLCMLFFAGCCPRPAGVEKQEQWSVGVLLFLFNVAMCAIFVSLFVVICGLFTINRYNATGRGALLV